MVNWQAGLRGIEIVDRQKKPVMLPDRKNGS